jgi:hypothetical protein
MLLLLLLLFWNLDFVEFYFGCVWFSLVLREYRSTTAVLSLESALQRHTKSFYCHFAVRSGKLKIQPLRPGVTKYFVAQRSKELVSAVCCLWWWFSNSLTVQWLLHTYLLNILGLRTYISYIRTYIYIYILRLRTPKYTHRYIGTYIPKLHKDTYLHRLHACAYIHTYVCAPSAVTLGLQNFVFLV